MSNCKHEKTICPQHGGGFDCNPFCDVCEAEQEYCPKCDDVAEEMAKKFLAASRTKQLNEQLQNALKVVLGYLENNNAHTLAIMLEYEINGCEDKDKDELLYRTYLVAKNFLYSGDITILGRK